MLTDGLILSLIISGALSLLGWKLKNQAVTFISSLGWLICSLQVYQETAAALPMILILMLSVSQVLLFKRGD